MRILMKSILILDEIHFDEDRDHVEFQPVQLKTGIASGRCADYQQSFRTISPSFGF